MKKGFTLVEVLITLAIIIVLVIAVVLVLNPQELIKQGRDASRISNLSALDKALSLYYSDALNNPATLFLGTSSVIYVSIPDSSTTCGNLGLPILSAGWTYHCAPKSTYQKIDGTGWIPVKFNAYSAGSVISNLPVDPINVTSSNLYYTYTTDSIGGYKLTAYLESSKDQPQMASDTGVDPFLEEKGSNLALASGRGLIGYWPLNEAAGTTATDLSGFGNTGAWSGASSYGQGKNWSSAATFSATSSYITVPTTNTAFAGDTPLSFTAWVLPQSNCLAPTQGCGFAANFAPGVSGVAIGWYTGQGLSFGVNGPNGGSAHNNYTGSSTWEFVVGTFANNTVSLYVNGSFVKSDTGDDYVQATNAFYLGSIPGGGSTGWQSPAFTGSLNDVRLYDRALSASEIQSMYTIQH